MTEEPRFRKRVFIIRLALGLFFSFFLIKFFHPGSGAVVYLFTAIVLVFFSYIFEYIRKKSDGRS